MRTRSYLTLLLILLLTSVFGTVATAEEEGGFSGWFDIGTRSTSVDGNENKFREDVNLRDGSLRLFDLSMSLVPEGNGSFLDRMTLDAGGLGGEPSSFARFRARGGDGKFDLKLNYRAADRFYRDDGYFFSTIGDLHSMDVRRERYDLGLKIRPTRNLTFRLGAESVVRDGDSTTSRDIQRDEFILNRPVDQDATEYWLGIDYRAGWANLTVEQRVRSWDNNWNMAAVGTDGLNPGEAFLNAYSQSRVEQGDAPLSRFQIQGSPWRSLRFSAGFQRVNAESDYRVSGSWDGLDYTDTAYSTVLTNEGRLERTYDLLDTELVWLPRENLEIGLEFDSRSWDQDGNIDYLEVQTGGAEAGNYVVAGMLSDKLETDTLGLTVRWLQSTKLTLWAGAGITNRDAEIELAGPAVETERSVYRGGVQFRPTPAWDIKLDYETGDDEDPYTPVSPTSTDRVRAKITVRPSEKLQLQLRYRDESRENSLLYPLGMPTDDLPPATGFGHAEFNTTSWSLSGTWTGSHLDLSAGYHRIEIDSDADLVYVTGATFFPVFDIFTTLDSTDYVAETDMIRLSARARFTKQFSGGLNLALVSSDGTFPVDRDRYGVDLRYEFGFRLFLRAAWDSYSLDETNPYAGDPLAPTPDINDYDADLTTFALGYRF
jgi:hypothetical protein